MDAQKLFLHSQCFFYAYSLGYSLDHGVVEVLHKFIETHVDDLPKTVCKIKPPYNFEINSDWLTKNDFTEDVRRRIQNILCILIYHSCVFANASGRKIVKADDMLSVTLLSSEIINVCLP